MGQYHHIVCPTRAEYLYSHALGCGLKAWEQLANHPGTTSGLAILLAANPGNAPGDLSSPLTGRWAGQNVAVIGDYAEDGDIAGWSWEPLSEVYGLCTDSDDEPTFENTIRFAEDDEHETKRRRLFEEELAHWKAWQAKIAEKGWRIYANLSEQLHGIIEYACNVRYCRNSWGGFYAVPVTEMARKGMDVAIYELANAEDRTLDFYGRVGIKPDQWHRPPRSGHQHGMLAHEVSAGQSRVIANLDKREFLDPLHFGEVDTLAGIVRSSPWVPSTEARRNGEEEGAKATSKNALFALLLHPKRRGSGDVEGEYVGRWRGDRIVITSEYESDDLPSTEEVRRSFADLSPVVQPELVHILEH